ncbi:hypothetical protein TWF730_006100 [Orbilia blumenaviensis]|uniref:F-box domain-containing protein n=1 Tax=Orbilia blumenaviensis TaxID=1796055 RepID=A0AAV9TWX2_9PEZI
MASTAKVGISSLPCEILIEILCYLSDIVDQLHASHVCALWADALSSRACQRTRYISLRHGKDEIFQVHKLLYNEHYSRTKQSGSADLTKYTRRFLFSSINVFKPEDPTYNLWVEKTPGGTDQPSGYGHVLEKEKPVHRQNFHQINIPPSHLFLDDPALIFSNTWKPKINSLYRDYCTVVVAFANHSSPALDLSLISANGFLDINPDGTIRQLVMNALWELKDLANSAPKKLAVYDYPVRFSVLSNPRCPSASDFYPPLVLRARLGR